MTFVESNYRKCISVIFEASKVENLLENDMVTESIQAALEQSEIKEEAMNSDKEFIKKDMGTKSLVSTTCHVPLVRWSIQK